MKKNKTEAIVSFYGEGSKQSKRDIAKNGSIIEVQTRLGNIDLRIVSNYKHLGTSTAAIASNCAEEVYIRSSIMSQQNRKLKKIFNMTNVSTPKKLHVASAYLIS